MLLFNLQNVTELVMPIIFILAGLITGLIIESIMSKAHHKASLHNWEALTITLSSFRRLIVLWSLLLGLYGSILFLPLKTTVAGTISKLLLVIFMFSVIVVIARVVEGFLTLYTTKMKGMFPSISLFMNLIKLIIYILGTLIILQFLGISVTPILTALGVGGLAVALALQDTLSNLFSGIQIIASRQVKPGDYIKLNTGEEGYVTDITWRNTTIQSLSENMIIAPNSKIASSIIVNYCQPIKQMIVIIEIGVTLDSNLTLVEKITLDIAKEVMQNVPGGVPDYEPVLYYHSFAESNINLRINVQIQELDNQYLIKHEFIKKLNTCFKDNNINMPLSIKTVATKTLD